MDEGIKITRQTGINIGKDEGMIVEGGFKMERIGEE